MSTAPSYMDAFERALKDRAALEKVNVSSVPLPESQTKAGDTLSFVGVTHSEDVVSLGRPNKEELYFIDIAINAAVPGAGHDKAVEARDRVYDIYREVQTELLDNPRYAVDSGYIAAAQIVNSEFTHAVQSNVRSAQMRVSVQVQARIT